jgi:uncharacterized protein (DUF433 family)
MSEERLINRITINPNQCSGRPTVRGMRIRVTDVLELLATGLTAEQVLGNYPTLKQRTFGLACYMLLKGLTIPC